MNKVCRIRHMYHKWQVKNTQIIKLFSNNAGWGAAACHVFPRISLDKLSSVCIIWQNDTLNTNPPQVDLKVTKLSVALNNVETNRLELWYAASASWAYFNNERIAIQHVLAQQWLFIHYWWSSNTFINPSETKYYYVKLPQFSVQFFRVPQATG